MNLPTVIGRRSLLRGAFEGPNLRAFSTDLDYAKEAVRQHDPAGMLAGRLLPEDQMRRAYYAVRCFWVETGLRFGSTAKVPPNASPGDHLDYWQQGIDQVFQDDRDLAEEFDHPSLRLLQDLIREEIPWEKRYFDEVLDGRRKDLLIKQYATLDELVEHAEESCGSLSELVLLSGNILPESSPVSHVAARKVGICHGLTNALRTSIPVMSTTGRLIVPADLTEKYGVKSPRYLLSALGQGDVKCVQALQHTVEHIVKRARDSLEEARSMRESILSEPGGTKAVAVLLPGLASETFLNRLEKHNYQLTDRGLRNVGRLEHALCASRMIASYLRKAY